MSFPQTHMRAAVAAALALSCTGCVYLRQRGQDLQDSIFLHAGVGLGVEAHVSLHSSRLILGAGQHESDRIGIDGW